MGSDNIEFIEFKKSLIYVLLFVFFLNIVNANIYIDVKSKQDCPVGYVVQNLTNSNKVECVDVDTLVNLTSLNNSIINISYNLNDYAKLNSSNQPFYDSSLKNSMNTQIRTFYNILGNPLCTWSNALGTGFDCVTLSQNGNTVLDTSNFVSYVNATYGNNYCENSTTIVIGAYDAC